MIQHGKIHSSQMPRAVIGISLNTFSQGLLFSVVTFYEMLPRAAELQLDYMNDQEVAEGLIYNSVSVEK
jgi:fumarate reductase subunit C